MVRNSTGSHRGRAAIAIIVVSSLGFSGILGLATARDTTSGEFPFTWSVAAPHLGDFIRYTRTPIAPNGTATGEPAVAFEFEWLANHVAFDGDSRVRELHRGAFREFMFINHTILQSFDPLSGQLVAQHLEQHDVKYKNGTGTGGVPYSSRHEYVRASTVHPRPDAYFARGPLCGLRSSFQSQSVDVSRLADPFGTCIPLTETGTDRRPQPTLLRAVGSSDDGSTLVLEGVSAENTTMRVWLSRDSPYPIQFTVVPTNAERAVAYQLEIVRRGTEPLPPAFATAITTIPAPSFAPRKVWGPDDTGLSHPFPLSAAYELALADPKYERLRSFVRSHPEAYVFRADYRESIDRHEEGHQFSHHWVFSLTSETEQICVSIEKRTGTSRYTVLQTDGSHSYGTCKQSYDAYVPPSKAPIDMPTVQSLFNAWSLMRGPDYEGRTPNFWSFSISCYISCSTPKVQLSAGFAQEEFTGSLGLGTTWLTKQSTISWSDHHWAGSVEFRSDFKYGVLPQTGAPRPPPAAAGPPEVATAFTARTSDVWTMPSAKVTMGASVLAILMGIAYYLWPAIKAGPIMGLYSRVIGPRVLEHPKRSELHQLIEQNPGIHFLEICRRTGIGHGVAEHHLAKMRESGLVTRTVQGEHHCYFIPGQVDRRLMDVAVLLKSEAARAVLDAVRQRPGLRAVDVAARAQLSPPNVTYHLDRLRQAGLIVTDRTSSGLAITLTELGRRAASDTS